MTWKLLQLAFPLVFIGIAFYLYRKNRALLVGFREQLAVSPKGRRFVVMVALLTLLVYHFIALCGSAEPLQLLPSSILSFLLFSEKYGDSLVRLFHRKCWMYYAFVVILIAFFLPQTTPMAVTLMVLLITSWGYPTKEMMKKVSERGGISDIIEDTIEGLRNEMADVNSVIVFDAKDIPQEASDVDTETAPEEISPVLDVEEYVGDDSPVSEIPSEKVIRNQRKREIDRERRHKRAKRRARRTKKGR